MTYENQTVKAVARMRGGAAAPELRGTVRFYQQGRDALVVTEITGLPESEAGFFALHIHEGGSCDGDGFPETGDHYNPRGQVHPIHAGDLPPLLRARGRAYMAVVTDRFRVEDIIGRTAVIHSHPDDFHTQPSGGAGTKIACGVIRGA